MWTLKKRAARGFHSTKEVSKARNAQRCALGHHVSIPLRKFPRLDIGLPWRGKEKVSIPLRKFPRIVVGKNSQGKNVFPFH